MKEIKVRTNEAGQRFDKLLAKYLNKAPKSFIYKMLRKKNITLNDKKASGSEILSISDCVKIFLSDETYDKFSENIDTSHWQAQACKLDIIYEDAHILVINKPSGMLSQKAESDDVSLVEHVISYLLESKQLTQEDLRGFRPAVCNRLDRNTSGIVVAGKSLLGLQVMSKLFKDRSLHKYYRCYVGGEVKEKLTINGYLHKDELTNKVSIYETEVAESKYIQTQYEPLDTTKQKTLLEVLLITGRTHQIRAHLASIGHPIIGDYKYGNKKTNAFYKQEFQIQDQMLHSYRLVMPKLDEPLAHLSNKEFIAPVPDTFLQINTKERG